MKSTLLACIVFASLLLTVGAQPNIKVYTTPKLPMRDALERMNLMVAWNARVTVDGTRDGVFSVQFIPGGSKSNQIVVQTYKGAVFLYDADNGNLIWKTQVGEPYWTPQAAAFNSQCIFVTRRNVLHVLNRADGSQRVYTTDAGVKQVRFGHELFFLPNTAPVAAEDPTGYGAFDTYLYFNMGDRVNAYHIPDFEAIERARRKLEKLKKEGKENRIPDPLDMLVPEGDDPPQPEYYWGYRFGNQFSTSSPLVAGEQISILSTSGTLTSLGRIGKGPREEHFEFKMIGKSLGAPGQHNMMAYLGSDDFNLYAINMNNGRLTWRYAAGAPIMHGPNVNDRDVFVAPYRVGMRRVDRQTGREVWTNRDAERFLAANDAFVYALDRHGRFYVLDVRRGTTLANYDLSDWAISIPNEWTDRIYLAANDGQVMCLRHRELAKPMVMKTFIEPKLEEKKPEPKKDDEKKDDDKKDDKKDDKEKAARLGRLSMLQQIPGPVLSANGTTHANPILATLDDRRHWMSR